jgi:hypothetical protein
MGFFNRLTSGFGAKARSFVDRGINFGRKSVNALRRTLGKVNSYVDEMLDVARNYPILSDLARQLEANPHYAHARQMSEDLDELLGSADEAINSIEGVADGIGGAFNSFGRGNVPHYPEPDRQVDLGYDDDYVNPGVPVGAA